MGLVTYEKPISCLRQKRLAGVNLYLRACPFTSHLHLHTCVFTLASPQEKKQEEKTKDPESWCCLAW